jgi:rhodanese-related sulfurtransferase
MWLRIFISIFYVFLSVSVFSQKIDTLNIEETLALINSDTAIIVLDCRDSLSFRLGHLPRAIHLDVYDAAFDQKLQAFDKGNVYLIYCKTNGRSANMVEQMIDKGFAHIFWFESGFLKWKESENPVQIE